MRMKTVRSSPLRCSPSLWIWFRLMRLSAGAIFNGHCIPCGTTLLIENKLHLQGECVENWSVSTGRKHFCWIRAVWQEKSPPPAWLALPIASPEAGLSSCDLPVNFRLCPNPQEMRDRLAAKSELKMITCFRCRWESWRQEKVIDCNTAALAKMTTAVKMVMTIQACSGRRVENCTLRSSEPMLASSQLVDEIHVDIYYDA